MSRPLLVHGCRLLNLTGVHDWHKPVLYTLGQIQGSCTIVPCTAFSTTDRGEYSTKPGKAYTSTIGKPVITIPVTGKSTTAWKKFFFTFHNLNTHCSYRFQMFFFIKIILKNVHSCKFICLNIIISGIFKWLLFNIVEKRAMKRHKNIKNISRDQDKQRLKNKPLAIACKGHYTLTLYPVEICSLQWDPFNGGK